MKFAKSERELAEIAIQILDGVWGNENEAGGALELSRAEIAEVRRLMHLPYPELALKAA